MLSALVETFGKELKVEGKEIGEYLKDSEFNVQSASLPFKNIERDICLILLCRPKDLEVDRIVYLGYWIGTSDVPSIPAVLVGEPKSLPIEVRRSLRNIFCVKESNLASILQPLMSVFSKSRALLEQASLIPIDARVRLREQLVADMLKIMKEQGYNMEEYKEELV